MVRARTMVNDGATVDQVAAVGRVIRDAGFEGECAAELAAQGEGIWAVMLDIGPKVFFSGLVGAAGVDGWKRLKALIGELKEAFGADEDARLQIYLRPDVVTKEEWEASDRKLGPPGFHRSNKHHAEDLLVDSLMPDEELKAIINRYRDTPDSDPIR